MAADKGAIYHATQNEGLRELLLGELPQDSLNIPGGRTLPVLPMPGDSSAGWLLVMGFLYHQNPSLSLVRGRMAVSEPLLRCLSPQLSLHRHLLHLHFCTIGVAG